MQSTEKYCANDECSQSEIVRIPPRISIDRERSQQWAFTSSPTNSFTAGRKAGSTAADPHHRIVSATHRDQCWRIIMRPFGRVELDAELVGIIVIVTGTRIVFMSSFILVLYSYLFGCLLGPTRQLIGLVPCELQPHQRQQSPTVVHWGRVVSRYIDRERRLQRRAARLLSPLVARPFHSAGTPPYRGPP
jgi:hypothetical protein